MNIEVEMNTMHGSAKHMYDNHSDEQENLLELCGRSNLLFNWHKYFLSLLNQHDNSISKFHPNFYRTITTLTRSIAFVCLVVLAVWAIAASALHCSDGTATIKAVSVFTGFMLLLVYTLFAQLWRGSVSEIVNSKNGSVSMNNFEATLNVMTKYLDDQNRRLSQISNAPTLIYLAPEWKYFYWFFNVGASICLVVFAVDAALQFSVIDTLHPCEKFYIYFSLGSFITLASFLCLSYACFFVMTTLWKTSVLCHSLVTLWSSRCVALQRVDPRRLEEMYHNKHDCNDYSSDIKSVDNNSGSVSNTSTDVSNSYPHSLSVLLKKDAYERYLLTCHFLQQTSKMWSLLFVYMLVVSTITFFWTIVMIVTMTNTALVGSACTFLAMSLLGFFFPVACMAYANSALGGLNRALLQSVPSIGDSPEDSYPGDFAVIGGRDEWLEYTQAVPLYWTVYGFAITPAWLQSFALGACTTLIVAVISSATVVTGGLMP